jgi:hypothetical protein
MTFVQDRGFWGEAFMNAMIDMDLCFIQWEKSYQNDGWSDNYIRRGKTTIIRRKNNAKDRSKLRFYFREQGWEKHAKGRRIIVRTNAVNGKVREFSIVTNDPELSAEKIIELIFNRWIQEGDFSYENSHFGLDEQTSRKTNAYEQLADSLEDREVESREYKKSNKQKRLIERDLGKQLLKLSAMPNPSQYAVKARRKQLQERLLVLEEEQSAVKTAGADASLVQKVKGKMKKLKKAFKRNTHLQGAIDKRREFENETAQIHGELNDLQELMKEMSRKESRLKVMIEEGKVKADTGRKALLDAIRVTSRNVFCKAHDIFRPLYENYREDHVTLRRLIHSSAVITQNADGTVNIFLTPKLERQAAQWRRIRKFLDIVEHRIRQQFGVIFKFHVNCSDAQIFDAATRMRERLKGPK